MLPKMDEKEQELFDRSVPLDDLSEEEIISFAGYQVTKAELFAHSREPSLTIWRNRLKFNMACLKRFPDTTHIQILINPNEKRMIIRPCSPDTPDCLRWTAGGGEKEVHTREMMCKFFAAKLFDLMEWDELYRYKVLGKPASCDGEFLFLFKLNDFELFLGGRRKGSYLPTEWRDYFGVPAEKHDEEYKINLADGYITTDKV